MEILANKLLYTTLLSVLAFSVFAQQPGIEFERALNWADVQAKAKREHKYIFLDCYASWCGPCKLMDKQVYPNDSLGKFVNAHFISLKVQMDTSKKDGDGTRKWYADAHRIMTDENVDAFPTFLFFSPEGKIVHEGIGYKGIPEFMALCKDALAPDRQYFTLLNNYKEGRKDFSFMPYLATTTLTLGNQKMALRIARDYIDNYLGHIQDSELYTKDNINFVRQFSTNSKDKGFQLMYSNPDKVDKIMSDSLYSQPFVDYIIAKEEINPSFAKAAKDSADVPNWDSIQNIITKKYGQPYADRILASAKARWNKYKEQWSPYTKNLVLSIQLRWPRVSNFELNEAAYDIFIYCSDVKAIDTAIGWMRKVVQQERDSSNVLPASMDTYANLLYKSGSKDEAISMEENALAMAIKFKVPNFIDDFKKTIEKMKQGQPTWLLQQN